MKQMSNVLIVLVGRFDTTSQKFLKISYVFLKKFLLLTKPAFIWPKIQEKQ